MMQVPKWLFYGLLACSFACAIGLTVLFAKRRTQTPVIIQSATDSLALHQKDVLIQQLQSKIDYLETQDSILAAIDAKLSAQMSANEAKHLENIMRIRNLSNAEHTLLLSKNISESLSYRRRYNYQLSQ